MADLSLEFCGIKFKHPIIIASLETTNSPEVIKECVDAGAAGMIVKTLTDIEDMARLTQNSKYAILNEKNELIKGKVNKKLTTAPVNANQRTMWACSSRPKASNKMPNTIGVQMTRLSISMASLWVESE